MRVLGRLNDGGLLLAVPKPAKAAKTASAVIPTKTKFVYPLSSFGDFGASGSIYGKTLIPQDYQPPQPRKAREIYGIMDVGFHKSMKASGGNCDVTEILKKYFYDDTRGWVEYCDCMYDRTDPNWAKCNAKFCGTVCLEPEGKPGSAKMCCPHENLPGFYSPYNINPARGSPPWEDFGVGSRGLPKPGAGIMADIGAGLEINWDDYQPLKLWNTFWANPTKFAWMLAKLNIIPVFGAAVTVALTATAVPVALIPFAVADAQKAGIDASKAILDPVWKHAQKSVGMILKYVGKCGIGVNVLCGAGLVVQRAAQDQIDDGALTKPPEQGGIYDPTMKAVIAFLAKSGDKMVDAIANSVGSIWDGGLFAVMEAGFAAARDVVDVAATKKILEMLRVVASVGNVIASGVQAKKPFEKIADDIGEKLLGFRPSVFFAMAAKKIKGEKDKKEGDKKEGEDAALTYAKTALDQTGGSLEKMNTAVNDVGVMFDKLIAALEDISKTFGGGLDELVRMFQGAQSGVVAASQAATQVTAQVSSTAQALGVQPDGTLFQPAGSSLTALDQQFKISASAAAQSKAAAYRNQPISKSLTSSAVMARVNAGVAAGVTPPKSSPVPVPATSVVVPLRLPTTGLPSLTPPLRPPLPPVSVRVQPKAKKGGGGGLVATAGLGFAIGGPPGAIIGLLAGAAFSK
jgi:hypothetical protein